MDTSSADAMADENVAEDRNGNRDVPHQDPALGVLVGVINALRDSEIGITLHASGLIVSGTLISGRRYFELLIENLEKSQGVGAFGQLFAPFRDLYGEDTLSGESTEEEKESALKSDGFIHLRDAQTFSPTGHALPGRLWRARLTEITGWSIGTYGRIPPNEER
ncbi:hypothetical protein R4P71_30935 [Rhodococcus sp. IEGM 1304]|uniref:hypothetical protein n=1 Tax=Rhodococcus sp. IEGM 1304 TaxID=3082227 RepID=UPI002954A962|nr:hypothetical protein [Rhodococcus sp. IEGM 1304]MDV8128973.1 hypothetical protein [Rhodococcus sp. IEGM 1304]